MKRNFMKRVHFRILILSIFVSLFSSMGFARDYVRYKTLTGHTAAVVSVAFSPDGQTLASGDNPVRLWKLSSPRPAKPDYLTPPKPSANQVYKNAIRSVVWIVNPGIGEGSGVLIDKKFKSVIIPKDTSSRKMRRQTLQSLNLMDSLKPLARLIGVSLRLQRTQEI